ncbi:MAG: o-succinylbenzoate--CoA ligase [Bacteroidota bacterium]
MNLLAEHARNIPDRIALAEDGRTWTWARLNMEALVIAGRLRSEHGIVPGDVVSTVLENNARHVIILHAIFLCGAIVAPLNLRLSPAERARQIAHLQPRLLIAEDDPAASGVQWLQPESLFADTARGTLRQFQPVLTVDNSTCSILFTSGSSGVMKAVPHSWHNHRRSAEGSAANLGVREDDNWLCVIPLYHIGGLAIVTRSLIYGTAMTVHQRFDPTAALDTLRHGRITLLSVVPTMLQRIMDADAGFSAAAFPGLRAILLGGAAASRSLWEAAQLRGLPLLGTYGLTETCSQVVTASPAALQRMAGSAGQAIDGAEMQIRDEQGEILSAGCTGEICIRGEMVAEAYLRNPSLTAERFVDGWFRTGDIGLIDGNGFLHVLGRCDDMIVSGGENVYPSEIEDVLLRHSAVADAAVAGIEDAVWGMKIAAVVVLRRDIDFIELETWCRSELAGYKIPRIWRRIDALPRTSSGKLIRSEVRRISRND